MTYGHVMLGLYILRGRRFEGALLELLQFQLLSSWPQVFALFGDRLVTFVQVLVAVFAGI